MGTKETELERIGHMLNVPYLNGGLAYEIVFAEKHEESGNWTLELKKVDVTDGEKNEEKNCSEGE